jgi:anti-sigma factor RsiW
LISDAWGRSLNRDHNAPPDLDDDDDLEAESHAADEPTAVWDETALRAAGLTDLLKRREAEVEAAPATRAVVPSAESSIVIDEGVTPGMPQVIAAEPASPAPRGLGWAATLAIAVVLGGAVYYLIRLLRG